MRYYLDTEFIEHATGIELLSLGIVSEKGESFYAENTAVDLRLADKWVGENVLPYLGKDNNFQYGMHGTHYYGDTTTCQGDYSYIHQEILNFLKEDDKPEFYAYYGAYDWVVFCKIFGRMIDLPKKFPMYVRDLKQILDEKIETISDNWFMDNDLFMETAWKDYYVADAVIEEETKLRWIKSHDNYPKAAQEHHALADAKWNLELHHFIKKYL